MYRFVLVFALFGLTAGNSFGEERVKNRLMGAEVGVATIKSGGGSKALFTGRIGAPTNKNDVGEFVGGFNLSYLSDNQTFAGVSVDTSYLAGLGEFFVNRFVETGIFFGGRLGAALVSGRIKGNGYDLSASTMSIIYGPFAGYGFPINEEVDLVFDFSYLIVGGGNLTFPLLPTVHYDPTAAFTSQVGVSFRW